MNLDIRIDELLPHPAATMWGALTDAASISGWLTHVTFELAPEGDGTRLTLTHAGEIDPVIGGLLADGWPSRIELLRRSLD